eukprot:Nk52_evm6s696 gene=Nk52_evmTU6s696
MPPKRKVVAKKPSASTSRTPAQKPKRTVAPMARGKSKGAAAGRKSNMDIESDLDVDEHFFEGYDERRETDFINGILRPNDEEEEYEQEEEEEYSEDNRSPSPPRKAPATKAAKGRTTTVAAFKGKAKAKAVGAKPKAKPTNKLTKVGPPMRVRPIPVKDMDIAPREIIGGRRQKTVWEEYEVDMLIKGVKKFGFGNWKTILEMYPALMERGRTNVDLKDKWRVLQNSMAYQKRIENISSESNRRPRKVWSKDETDALKRAVKKYGKDWKKISETVEDFITNGRTNVDLKDKWRVMERQNL